MSDETFAKLDWKPNLNWFRHGCQKRMFVEFCNWIRRSSQSCSPLSGESLLIFEELVQHLLNMCLLLCLLYESSVNHIPIKYRGLIKKTSQLRPIYLNPYSLWYSWSLYIMAEGWEADNFHQSYCKKPRICLSTQGHSSLECLHGKPRRRTLKGFGLDKNETQTMIERPSIFFHYKNIKS